MKALVRLFLLENYEINEEKSKDKDETLSMPSASGWYSYVTFLVYSSLNFEILIYF